MAQYRLTRPHFIDGFILHRGVIVETDAPGEFMEPVEVDPPSEVETVAEPLPTIADVLEQLPAPASTDEAPKPVSLVDTMKNAVSFVFQSKKD